jgi:protein-disulfide isomerase
MRETVTALVGVILATNGLAQSFESEARRFASAYLPYKPNGVLEVRVDRNGLTPSGAYLVVTVTRQAQEEKSADTLTLLVDPQRRTVAAGLVAALPQSGAPMTAERLPKYAEQELPAVLSEMLGTRVRVRWPTVPERPSGVVSLTAELSTGYGWSKWPLSLSADGKYLLLGATWPLARDPRAVRREVLASELVEWDPGNEGAPLQFVEFSDYECPACKRAWASIKPVLAQFGRNLRHGMVGFPLVQNHPWAFRAAVAGRCIGALWPDRLLAFKDEMYRLQDTLSVETVDEAVLGFLVQQSLDEKAFRSCYLKDPAVDRVLAQLNLGQQIGVLATPSYFVNGEHVSHGDPQAMAARLQAILAAGGLPEKAP